MIKHIVASALIIVGSGCTGLQKLQYLSASGPHTQPISENAQMGIGDITFWGKSNVAVVKYGDYSAEIQSTPYYWRTISFGPILPIIPLFLNSERDYRRIRIENKTNGKSISVTCINTGYSQNSEIIIGYPSPARENEVFPTIPINQKINLNIPTLDYIWLCLPESKNIEIQIQLGEKIIPVKLRETNGFMWTVPTV